MNIYPECIGCKNYYPVEELIEEDVYYCSKDLIPDAENEDPSCYEEIMD